MLSLIIYFLFLILVVLLFPLVIYYQFDEELEPEVRAALEYSPKPIPDEDNAYYSLLGVYADYSDSPFQHGISIVKAAKSKYVLDKSRAIIISKKDTPNIFQIELHVEDDQICKVPDKPCLPMVRQNRKKTFNILFKNKVLISRLRDVYSYKKFKETKYLWGFDQIILLHRMYMANLAFFWLEGNKSQVITSLNKSIIFWRMVSNSDISLITRMISIVNLEYSYGLLAEIITDCGKCSNYYKGILEILEQPLTKEELSMGKVTRHEFLEVKRVIEMEMNKMLEGSEATNILYRVVYKPNSLTNKIYNVYNDMRILSECAIKEYLFCRSKHAERNKKEFTFISRSLVNDPIGYVISEVARPAYIDYPEPMFMLEAKRRLIFVKLRAVMKSTSVNELPMFLLNLPDNLKSPFGETKIRFNKDKHQLQIDCEKNICDTLVIAL